MCAWMQMPAMFRRCRTPWNTLSWVLGSEVGFRARAASALSPWPVFSPAPRHWLLKQLRFALVRKMTLEFPVVGIKQFILTLLVLWGSSAGRGACCLVWHGSVDICAYGQASQPESDPQDPHGSRRETTSFFLCPPHRHQGPSTSLPWIHNH